MTDGNTAQKTRHDRREHKLSSLNATVHLITIGTFTKVLSASGVSHHSLIWYKYNHLSKSRESKRGPIQSHSIAPCEHPILPLRTKRDLCAREKALPTCSSRASGKGNHSPQNTRFHKPNSKTRDSNPRTSQNPIPQRQYAHPKERLPPRCGELMPQPSWESPSWEQPSLVWPSWLGFWLWSW
jgi:hypothetical protein